MFQRILSLYDFSWTGRQALQWALRTGETFHAEVNVLHVVSGKKDDATPPALATAIREEIDRDLRLREAAAAKPVPKLGSLEVTAVTGHVVSTILDWIVSQKPDLVVMGTHGQTGLLHVLLGSVAEKVVRHSTAPTLVVRGAFQWPPRCILLPLAFDESAEEALLAASELRQRFHARLEIIHVVTPPPPQAYPPEVIIAMPHFDAVAARKQALERLNQFAAKHPSLSLVHHIEIGQPAAKICEKAREIGADLILIPTHDRTALNRWLLGSAAEQVVRYAPCPVLSFQPGRFHKP